jgi:hypothetical protein
VYLVALKSAKWRFWLRSEHSWEFRRELIRNFQRVSRERLSGKSSAVCLAGLLGRRNGPLRPTFVSAKRSSDAPEHHPGYFPDSL